jgi:hypothetical protein
MQKGTARNLLTIFSVASCFYIVAPAQTSKAQEQPVPVKCGPNTDAKILERHRNSDLYNFFDKKCNGHPDIVAYNAWLDAKNPLAEHDAERRKQAKLPPLGLNTAATPVPQATAWNSYFVLRDSYQDISIFSSPKPASSASGASFGYTRDAIGSNTSWTAKGVAAYPVVWQNLDPPPVPRFLIDPYLAGVALSPSVKFQRVTDTNPKFANNNVDLLTFAGTAEAAFSNIFDTTTLHYFRSRTSAIGTFEGDVHSWSETVEYQPFTGPVNPLIPKLSSPNNLGTLPATWELDAIFRYQYLARATTTTDPLFGKQDYVSRAGGVLALTIAPYQGPASPVPQLLQRVSFNASYSWTQNLATKQPYPLFNASLGFALDESGNLGIKVSYEDGLIEDTGQKAKLTMVVFAAKY